MEKYCKDSEAKSKDIYAYTIDNSHEGLEKRECFVCNDIGWLDHRGKWTDIHEIGMIVAKIVENVETFEQRRYFIYSCKNLNTEKIMKAKRNH